jgi:hypothetical protein
LQSRPRALRHTITKALEISGIDRRGGCRTGAIQKHFAKALSILILADQLPHILTARAVTTHVDLLVHKRLERVRKRDVHRRHGLGYGELGKIWQDVARSNRRTLRRSDIFRPGNFAIGELPWDIQTLIPPYTIGALGMQGRMVGSKRPLKPRDIWTIRLNFDEHRRLRDQALFALAIDSKLRGCDLVKIRMGEAHSLGRAVISRRLRIRGFLPQRATFLALSAPAPRVGRGHNLIT